MSNLSLSTLLYSLLLAIALTAFLPRANAAFSRPVSREELGLKASTSSHNLTQLTFYFHDTFSGSNPTVVQIAKASTSTSVSSFGSLLMLDNPLTDGPDSTSSKLVGRAQGMYALADQSENAPITIMNLLFLEAQYNGSTLSVLGRNPVNQGVRELPVVGGTGVFRFAKGYAQAKTHTFDQTTGDSVVEYNVFISEALGSGLAPGPGGAGDFGPGLWSPAGSPAGSSKPNNGANSRGLGLINFVASLCLFPLLYLVC